MTLQPDILVRVPGWNLPWLVHGFSTRQGGVSTVYQPHIASAATNGSGDLNLGWTKDDSPENVAENRRRLVAAVTCTSEDGAAPPLVTVRQVHSASTLLVHAPEAEPLSSLVTPEGRALREADGLITEAPGVLLGIQTADCVPVFVVDPRLRAVGNFHAGWRGTVARIVEHGVARMIAEFGSNPADLIAAVGPSIASCCYTVGEQVHAAFREAFLYGETLFARTEVAKDAGQATGPDGEPPLRLDLWEANRRQLLDAGIAPDRITVIGECTGCTGLPGPRLYFSHRCEQGFTGRMMSVIGIGIVN
jgi:YfiH family protein